MQKNNTLTESLRRTEIIMRRGSLSTTLSLLSCLNHLSSAPSTPLCSGCQNYFLLNPFCSIPLIILVVFQNRLNCRMHKTKFPVHIRFLFSISCLLCHFNFSFDTQHLPFIRDQPCYVTSLLLTAGIEMQRAPLHRKRTAVTSVILQAWNLSSYLKVQRDCPLKDEEVVEFLELHAAWKILVQPMTVNVISEVDALMYFVLCKAGKHMPCGELVGVTECMTLYLRSL